MQEQIAEVLNYVKGTLKYRWVILTITWMVCIGGWLFVSAMQNNYTSEARVQVDSSELDRYFPGRRPDLGKLLQRIQQLMYTKTSLEQIISLSDMDKELKTDRDRQKLLAYMSKYIKITGSSDQLLKISFEATNPASAQKVLQAVLTVFSEYSEKGILSDSVKSLKFMEARIKDYEDQLKHAEKAKEEFTRSILLQGGTENDGGSVADLKSINKQLREAKIQLTVAISRKNALQTELDQIVEEGGWDIPASNEPLTEEDQQIYDLKEQLKALRVNYLDSHPKIISILRRINEFEKIKQIHKTNRKVISEMASENHYLQTIREGLSEETTQVAAAQAMVDELSQLKNNIEKNLDDGLRAETELKQLNRNYETIKSTYDQLVKDREDLILSLKIDELGALQFKISDAPNVPLEPSSPNRKLLFSAVFAVGIILGFTTAFLLNFVRPTIMSTSQIKQLIGLPILGSVSMKSSPDLTAKNKMEAMKYAYATFGLVCIYVGLMTVDLFEIKVLTLSHWL